MSRGPWGVGTTRVRPADAGCWAGKTGVSSASGAGLVPSVPWPRTTLPLTLRLPRLALLRDRVFAGFVPRVGRGHHFLLLGGFLEDPGTS